MSITIRQARPEDAAAIYAMIYELAVYEKAPEACISCGQCELRCPDFAIRVVKKEKEAAK